MSLVHPIDAYKEARNGTPGFVGWAHYQETQIGLRVASRRRVEFWTADRETEKMITTTDKTPDEFLHAIDQILR